MIPGTCELVADVIRRQGPLPALRVSSTRSGGFGLSRCEIRLRKDGFPTVIPIGGRAERRWSIYADAVDCARQSRVLYDGPVGRLRDRAAYEYLQQARKRYEWAGDAYAVLQQWAAENESRWLRAREILGMADLPSPLIKYPYYLRVIGTWRNPPIQVVEVPGQRYLYVPGVRAWRQGGLYTLAAVRKYAPHVMWAASAVATGAPPEEVRAALQLAE